MMRTLRCLVVCGWMVSLVPVSAAAQPAAGDTARGGWRGEMSTLGINALLGGGIGGTVRALRGGSFYEGFVAGAAGGTLVYAGKRLAVERWYGAGLAGRQVAAVGTSMIRNTADGRAPLERLTVPVWIGRLYVTTSPRLSVQPRLDLAGALSTAYQAFDDRSEFDLGRTISAGAPVFRVYDAELEWVAFQRVGVVLLRYAESDQGLEEQLPDDVGAPMAQSAAHERVHVVQLDQAFLLLAAPVEDWLLGRNPTTARLHRWIDVGAVTAVLALPELLIPYDRRPWEREADFLARLPR
ncbi:MAG TPA: hypothetical protein VFR37_09370 [Longimicrobium sp.]|nr:hypothetical protein [Longimicrobium sp.]